MNNKTAQEAKEDDEMMTITANNTNKQILLDELKDSLLELNEKRKCGYTKSANHTSWQDLFNNEDDEWINTP